MAVQAPLFKRRFSLALTSSLVLSPISAFVLADQHEIASQWRCQADATNNWVCERVAHTPSRWQRAQLPAHAIQTQSAAIIAATPEQQVPVSRPVLSASQLKQNLDWVPLAQLDLEQRSKVAPHCSGRYVEPPREGIDDLRDPSGLPILVEADVSQYQGGEQATMAGNILLRQGYRQVTSDRAKILETSEIGEFTGNVVLREPGMLLVGDQAILQMKNGHAEIDNAYFAIHPAHARGHADKLIRRENGLIDMEEASYTTCPPDSNSWAISASDISLNPASGFGSATHAVLRVKDVPVFYTPYIHFPIDDRRQSGFLYPEVGYSSENGTTLITPYYFNLAPNYDATITPRLMSERGLGLESEFRYLTETGEGQIGGSFLPSDNLKDENRNYDDNRWLFNVQDEHQLTSRWDVDLDFNNTSDKDYLRDFSTSLDITSTDNLNQQLQTRYRGGDDELFWNLTANMQGFKNLRQDKDDPYEKLPQLELQGGWNATNALSFSALADATYFTRDDDWKYIGKVSEADRTGFDLRYDVERSIYEEGSDELTNANGTRAYLETGASYSFEWPFAYITPTVKGKTVQYRLTNIDREAFDDPDSNPFGRKYDKSPSTTTPMFSVDSGLAFDRSSSYFGTNYTHTLEPRLFYLYVPEQEDQGQNPLFDTYKTPFSYSSLWREDRFSSYDRLGDANQVSLGVTTRLLDNKGFETFRFGIGQTYYFEDREVLADPFYGKDQDEEGADSNLAQGREWLLDESEATSSPIASELVWNINDASSLRQDWVYNVDQSWNQEYSVAYHYSPNPAKMFDIAYRFSKRADRTVKDDDGNAITDEFTDGSISQTDVSAIWPVYGNWSALGRWNHDLTNNESLEIMAGAEYDTCCYKVRLLHRQYLNGDTDDIENASTERAYVIQFVLKGLGGFGSNTQYLEGIKGYQEHEKSTNLQ